MTWLAIDHRSLRLFRAGLGAFLILDILFRAVDFSAFYTDAGVFPLELALARSAHLANWSLYYLSSSPMWASLLFTVTAIAGLLLIFNIRPRLVSLAAFILMLSLKNRNPLVDYGGDDLSRLALLWSAFLPSGPANAGEKSFSGPAALAAFVQVFALYFCAGMVKDTEAWFHDARGVYMALNGNTHARASASLLLPFPKLLSVLTVGVYLLERLGWLLFFSPWWPGVLRTVAVAAFATMHFSFGMFLHVELFPFIDITLLTLMLPPEFWDYLKVELKARPIPIPRLDAWLAPLAAILAVSFAYLNISYLPQINRQPLTAIRSAASFLGANQSWSMFAPIDDVLDGYHRMLGETEHGSVNLITGQQIDALPIKPVDVQAEQGGFRWTRYLETSRAQDDRVRRRLLQYFCDKNKLARGTPVNWYYFKEQTIQSPGWPPYAETIRMQSEKCNAVAAL